MSLGVSNFVDYEMPVRVRSDAHVQIYWTAGLQAALNGCKKMRT
jgi:hypothetical protein